MKKQTRNGRSADPLQVLYREPAFMIRRAHQIATATFLESCAELELTQSQYTVLFVLRHRGPLGQNEVGRLVSLDRATTSVVARVLARRRLISRNANPADRRVSLLSVTDPGRQLMARAERLRTRAARSLMSGFTAPQARNFIELLRVLTAAHDEAAGEARRGTR